jgi:hypothetical protein
MAGRLPDTLPFVGAGNMAASQLRGEGALGGDSSFEARVWRWGI